jgi:NADH-quinone oxidoreductase subunit F
MSNLEQMRSGIEEQYKAKMKRPRIVVGLGTCGIAAGGNKVMEAIKGEVAARGLDVDVDFTSCIGMCYAEPAVEISLPGAASVVYGGVYPDKVPQLIENHLVGKAPVAELAVMQIPRDDAASYEGISAMGEFAYYEKQNRLVTSRLGRTNPENIEDYIATGGYAGLEKALTMERQAVVDEMKKSGLRGRGGGGFSTGMKWQFVHDAVGDKKFIVCNADEGDPGAFMDRSVLEADPHAVIEGMAIGAYAIGAQTGYVYVRDEYPLACQRIAMAIDQADEYGLLGERIFDTDFSFTIKVVRGAGAFVCGEETALMASIEGRMGKPRQRPPFPAQKGLWGHPTNINNVETWANVPIIVLRGADWYASIGTEKSRGTKIFSLVGKVNNTGLVEVPMGISLRKLVFDIGGGIIGGKELKAVQTGGPSGGMIPKELMDLPVDYEKLAEAGSIMGSGGLIVMDETDCMVDIAKYFLAFTTDESCGKCTPCRVGTKMLWNILDDITKGRGKKGDIELLEEIAINVKNLSLCGLGQTAPNPILTMIRYFKDELEAHIGERKCPAYVCKELISYYIDPEKCNACMICLRKCPVDAITGGKNQIHVIDQEKCTNCGTCFEVCPSRFGAVRRLSGEPIPPPIPQEARILVRESK